eukprot:403336979
MQNDGDEGLFSSQHQSGGFNESMGDQLSLMMKDTYQIVIGNKKVKFDIHDEIFKLQSPNNKVKPSSSCNTCDKDLSKYKTSTYCQFCGCRQCSMCLHKDRSYQSSRMQVGLKGSDTGKICRMCDRKFIMFDTYAEYAFEIEQQDQMIKEHFSLLDQKQQQFDIDKEELNKLKQEVQEKEQSLKEHEFMTQCQSEDLDNQIDSIQKLLDKLKLQVSTVQQQNLDREKELLNQKENELQHNEIRYQTAVEDIKRKKGSNQNISNLIDDSTTRKTNKQLVIEGRPQFQNVSYMVDLSHDEQKMQISPQTSRQQRSGDLSTYEFENKVIGMAALGQQNGQANSYYHQSNETLGGNHRNSAVRGSTKKQNKIAMQKMEHSKACCNTGGCNIV